MEGISRLQRDNWLHSPCKFCTLVMLILTFKHITDLFLKDKVKSL